MLWELVWLHRHKSSVGTDCQDGCHEVGTTAPHPRWRPWGRMISPINKIYQTCIFARNPIDVSMLKHLWDFLWHGFHGYWNFLKNGPTPGCIKASALKRLKHKRFNWKFMKANSPMISDFITAPLWRITMAPWHFYGTLQSSAQDYFQSNLSKFPISIHGKK
jgi:hypothetical protein